MQEIESASKGAVSALIPAEKIVDVIAKGIGTLYRPTAIRKEADAEAYKMEVMAKAEAKAAIIKYETESEIQERARKRLYTQEMNRQYNIESVADQAMKYLPETVSPVEVSADWRTKFFTSIQDISDADLQDIWARVLAQEVAKPESTSIRLLDILTTMSFEEAQAFERFCSLVSNQRAVYKIPSKSLDEYGVRYGDLMMLRELRLLHEADSIYTNFEIMKFRRDGEPWDYIDVPLGNSTYQLSRKTLSLEEKTKGIPAYILTTSGQQLCRLLQKDINDDYVRDWIESAEQSGYKVGKKGELIVIQGNNPPE